MISRNKKFINKRMKNNYFIRRNKNFNDNKFKNFKFDKLLERKISYDYYKRFNYSFECQKCYYKH